MKRDFFVGLRRRREVAGLVCGLVAAMALAAAPSNARASSASFVLDDGTLSAQATFTIVSNLLILELENTGTTDVTHPSQLLTTLWFRLSGNPLLNKNSATLGPGATILNIPPANLPGQFVIGGEWGYKHNFLLDGVMWQGVSAIFGQQFYPHHRFPGPNLAYTNDIGGIDYALTSRGDVAGTGTEKTATDPLIKGPAVFVLAGLPQGFTIEDILEVKFQFGNSWAVCPNQGVAGVAVVIPEPGTAALLLASAGMLLRRRR